MTQTAVVHEIRPDEPRRALRIRAARNDEGETIRRLVTNGAFPDDMAAVLDWTDVSNYWIVADDGLRLVGCLQVVCAKPIGRIEYLGIETDLTHSQRARVVKKLLLSGCAIQKRAGIPLVSGTVPFEFKSYKRMLKRRGAIVTQQGNVFLKRV